jgi:CHAT domain-containing protein
MFFLGRRASVAWIVDRGVTEVVRLPPRGEIEAAAGRLLPTLRSPQAPVDEEARGWLSRAVVAPITAKVPESTHLVIVPHAILNYLPFEVLAEPGGRHLVERNPISYAPSVSSLAYLRGSAGRARREPTVLAVGNPATAAAGAAAERRTPLEWMGLLKPLPHSRTEIREVEATFRPHSRVLEGEQATEQALRTERLRDFRIVHFATHALIDERRPERSALALAAGADGSDGILQTREIYRLELDAALVTLSACETALGREVTGEGLVGISRAFFYAGADAVAASLWSVGDASTAELMTLFYGEVRRGVALDLALARAKRSFLAQDGRQHPYYWAPFVLSGHARVELASPDGARAWRWWALGAAALLVAAVIAVRRRQRRSGDASA